MTAAELRAAQKARATAAAREEREALREQQRAQREAAKAAERQERERQRAMAQAQREMLKEQQRMAREEQAARARAQRAMTRSVSGRRSTRSRRSSSSDPTTDIVRTVFGTLFGK
jgi:hypothetical protein